MNVEFPDNRNFPSGNIIDALKNIIENVAPEKFTKLNGRIDSISLCVSDSDEWICNASKNWESIFISRKTIEIIWAFCYSYWSIYDSNFAGKKPNGQIIHLGDDVSSEKKLLNWALDNSMNIKSELPCSWPSPSAEYKNGSIDHIAIELALMTIGFYLHHELAHVLLDVSGYTQIEEETACDKHAIDWPLSECPIESYNKRIFGISIGLSLMNVFGIHSGDFDGKTHPFAYDRLIDNLEKYVDKDNDMIWGWVLAILSIHMTQMRIEQPSLIHENFYDCVIEYRKIFENYSHLK